jgi:hypothetical protein
MSSGHKPGIKYKAYAAVSNGIVSFPNEDNYFKEGVEYFIHATPTGGYSSVSGTTEEPKPKT